MFTTPPPAPAPHRTFAYAVQHPMPNGCAFDARLGRQFDNVVWCVSANTARAFDAVSTPGFFVHVDPNATHIGWHVVPEVVAAELRGIVR